MFVSKNYSWTDLSVRDSSYGRANTFFSGYLTKNDVE